MFVRTHLPRKLLKIRKVFLDNETLKLYVFLVSLRQCLLHVDYWKKATCILLSDVWKESKLIICCTLSYSSTVQPVLVCNWTKGKLKGRMSSCLGRRGWRSWWDLVSLRLLMFFFHWNWMYGSCCCGFYSRNVKGLCDNTACVNIELVISSIVLVTLCFHFQDLQCKI